VSAAVHSLGPSVVVITLGEKGAFLTRVTGGGFIDCEQRKGHRIDGEVDPTGSGDVFLAAFTSATVLGRKTGEALSSAVRLSALSTTVKGAASLYTYFSEQ
jgi:sugar/nucleoside kinase (ribokinase family)